MKIVGDLTKAKVLELADEITIFSKYLGISESIIGRWNINNDTLFYFL